MVAPRGGRPGRGACVASGLGSREGDASAGRVMLFGADRTARLPRGVSGAVDSRGVLVSRAVLQKLAGGAW